jgi:ribonuclease BN (tRNA processing enzyme)
MRLTVLGGCGAWPGAGQACSGYLVEHEGFRLLVDPGYAIVPRLLERIGAADVDAVLVSHGHPDHCADLNPLLRGRVLADSPPDPPRPLPVFALPGAVDAVLALDNPRMMAGACRVVEVVPGESFGIGPFAATTRLLPHHVANVGLRLSAGRASLAYTGDTGPSPEIVELARGVDLLIAEATYPDAVPDADAPYLSSARQAGGYADAAGVGSLMLTHLWPGIEPERALAGAAAAFAGPTSVARPGLAVTLA